ncbi:MAG: hypothetical protein ACRD36_03145 [Candidatus Acidiferrum sp.]
MQQIHRVGILSCAKIAGITYAGIALVFVPIFLVMAVAGAFAAEKDAALGAAAIVVLALFMPIIYGVVGFLGGAFMAWLYNLVAKKFGGIEIELTPLRAAIAPPPASGAA